MCGAGSARRRIGRRLMLIVFGGMPGTGKTTLARLVARRRCGTYVRVDAIESGLVAAGLVADQADVGPAGYVVAHRIAESALQAGLDVVIDAVNPVEAAREGWRTLADLRGVPLLFVEVVCSERDQHRQRVEERESDVAGWAVPTWQAVVEHEYEPWQEPRLVIDNRREPARYAAAIEAAASAARRR